MSLGQILSLQWKKCSKTQAAWSDCQSMSKKTVGKKACIGRERKYQILKKIVIKYWLESRHLEGSASS